MTTASGRLGDILVKSNLLSQDELEGYLAREASAGQPLAQLLLADGRMVVSVSPQEGFLHQVSELDTLGVDQPESKCRLK